MTGVRKEELMGNMVRVLVGLGVLFLLLFYLQSRVGEQKQVRVEKSAGADELK
jgi:hypothetical protein